MQLPWQEYRYRFEFPCWQKSFATEIFKYVWMIILLWNLFMKRVRVLKCINCLAWQVYLDFKRKLLKKLIDRGFSRFPRQNQRRVRKKNCVKSFFPPPGQDPLKQFSVSLISDLKPVSDSWSVPEDDRSSVTEAEAFLEGSKFRSVLNGNLLLIGPK